MQAALKGAGEIGFTILSISISLVAVFIPLFLMSGIVGLLFREFAVTVAVAILVSVTVSLTLTPMMCSRLLTPQANTPSGWVSRAVERFFKRLVAVYDRGLVIALRHRLITLAVMIATICATFVLFRVIPKGFFPEEDTGMIIGIVEGDQGISPEGMMGRVEAVLEVVTKDPAVASATAYIGPGGSTVTENDGRMFITLKPIRQRASVFRAIARLNRALQPVEGVTLYMQAAQDITIGALLSKTQYQYTLVDVDSTELNYWAPILLQKLQGLAQLTGVASDQQSARSTSSWALYESTIHPITIISTLPSAGLGALLTLLLFGFPLDVIGIIGIILLIGIVKKNGIMLVDFALVGERERGLSTEDAIHEACLLRFRPILMTTMCALLAGVPLMLGTGIGSEIRQPLGYAIVGGLLVSQLMTLFTTPVVYIYMDRLSGWLRSKSRR